MRSAFPQRIACFLVACIRIDLRSLLLAKQLSNTGNVLNVVAYALKTISVCIRVTYITKKLPATQPLPAEAGRFYCD